MTRRRGNKKAIKNQTSLVCLSANCAKGKMKDKKAVEWHEWYEWVCEPTWARVIKYHKWAQEHHHVLPLLPSLSLSDGWSEKKKLQWSERAWLVRFASLCTVSFVCPTGEL